MVFSAWAGIGSRGGIHAGMSWEESRQKNQFCFVPPEEKKIKTLKKGKKAFTINFDGGEHRLQIDKQGECE